MNERTMLLIAGGFIFYLLIRNSQGAAALQAQMQASNLQTNNTVANANLVSTAAQSLAQDFSNISSDIP